MWYIFCMGDVTHSHVTCEQENIWENTRGDVKVCCSVLQCVAVCCSVLKCVAVCRREYESAWRYTYIDVCRCIDVWVRSRIRESLSHMSVSVLQCVAVCCSVLQCVAVCCNLLLCVAVMSRIRESLSHMRVIESARRYTNRYILIYELCHTPCVLMT